MKRIFMLNIVAGILVSLNSYGQVGEKVSSVKILNMNNDTVNLPFLGQKSLLIFYADPGRPRQNKTFRDYFKTHPINSPYVDSYGVINMAAAALIPNALIRKMAQKETAGTDAKVYLDPDNVLTNSWKLPGADNNFAVIFINPERVIEFYKAGELTTDEQNQVLALIKKYSRKPGE